ALSTPPRAPLFPYTTLFRSPERSSVDYRVERIRIDVEHRTEREVNSDRARFGAQHLPELEGEIFGASCAEGHDGREDSTAALRRSEEHTSELQSRGHLVCRL